MESTFASKVDQKKTAAHQGKVDDAQSDWQGAAAGMPMFAQRAVECAACDEETLLRQAVQPNLEISAPDDPAEREAERFAGWVMGTPGSMARPGAFPGNQHAAGGSSHSPGSLPGGEAVRGVLGSGGAPLPYSERAFFEPRLGQDLSHVRVHTNSQAAAAARSINARAFTYGQDIYFGVGRWAPGTNQGRRLIGHELAHVGQDFTSRLTTLIQRDSEPNVEGTTTPYLIASETPSDPNINISLPNQLDSDPCEVVVDNLTNEGLVLQIHRAHTYLISHGRGEGDFFAFANLMRRLAEERQQRMRNGHIWLGDDPQTMPAMLYQLSSGFFGEIQVQLADLESERGMPSLLSLGETSIVTPHQFYRFLEVNHIAAVDAETYFSLAIQQGMTPEPLRILPPLPEIPQQPQILDWELYDPAGINFLGSPEQPFEPLSPYVSLGIAGGTSYRTPFSTYGRSYLAEPVFGPGVNLGNIRSITGARSRWRGALPEIQFGASSYGLLYQDLNRIQGNFPIFDYRSRFGSQLISIKSVVPSAPSSTLNLNTYFEGFDDMVGIRRPTTFTSATAALNTEFGTSITAQNVISEAYLAVNIDHVNAVRDAIERRIRANPNGYIDLFNASLSRQPINIGNTSYTNWNNIPPADQASAVEMLARRSRLHIIDNGFTTEGLRNLLAFRERFQNIPQAEFGRLVTPELIEAERFGGGWSGTQLAMQQAMIRGGGQGAVLTAGIDLLRYAWDSEHHPNIGTELLIDVPTGVLGSASSAAIETQILSRWSSSMLSRTLAGGLGSVSSGVPLLARGFGGTVAGGFTAPVTTMAAMGLEELFTSTDYIYIDYLAKGARALPSGAIAGGGGALAAGGVGALAGSEVPILGTAIGFLVGIGLYYLSDSIIGDSIEEDVRLAFGEGGCPRPVPRLRNEREHIRFCFTGRTRIKMADGNWKYISNIGVGDLVLSFSLETGEFSSSRVQYIYGAPEANYLEIHFFRGEQSLQVTAEHPIYTADGRWVNAEDLQVGDQLFALGGKDISVSRKTITTISQSITLEPVYNMTVSNEHNFFAEDILVHNKIF